MLHRDGPLDPPALARGAGVHPRYAREWLEQQCVSGFVEVDDPDAEPDLRRYRLPDEHVAVLVDPTSLTFSTPLARLMTAAAARVPETADAFRTGGGVPWTAFGPDMREAQADGNRPWFLGPLGERWLPSVPGLDERLRAGAAVADLGCGEGWASIGIALAYPEAGSTGSTSTRRRWSLRERLLYGWSVLICLPDGMSHEGSVGTGTVMRPDVLRGYAEQAGLASVEVLEIEHDLWRFYRLVA